jgi:glucose/mannose-6-phosphate isomerase
MDLNNHPSFSNIDKQNYLSEIESLPGQLENSYQSSLRLSLPEWQGIQRVLIAGMGGSAIGADLLTAYASPLCPLPIVVQRNYYLPAWAKGAETLVVASSHSGNTEETLAVFEMAVKSNCRTLALCTGGKLAEAAKALHTPLWTYEHHGQPRAAVGYSFGMLLALFSRLGLIPDPADELSGAITAMRKQTASLQAVCCGAQSAKREAGQLIGRWVMVFGRRARSGRPALEDPDQRVSQSLGTVRGIA